MNKEQAYERLELPVGTDLQTVRKKFAEMHNDYRMRIENAPTPRLKQTFERGLEELKEAYALLNESERMDDVAELPRTERSFEQEEAVEKKASTASLKMDLPQAPAATHKPKQPIWAYVLIGALLVAAMGYFLLRPDAAQNVSSTDSFTAAKDSTAWEAALAGHSTATYQHYLSSYPDGIFATVAKDSLAKRNDAPSSENTAVELAIATVQQPDQVDTEATRRLAEQQKKRIAELEQQNREQTVAQDAALQKQGVDAKPATIDANTLYQKADALYKSENYTEAVKLYRQLADQGHKGAQFNLGRMYEGGYGVAKDFTQAVKWYQKAADQGYAEAQLALAAEYDLGRGITQDYDQVAYWVHKAANQGHKGAQHQLGRMYENGYAVKTDFAQAIKWYRKAADQGYDKAQYWLGRKYEDGHYDDGYVIDRDDAEAIKWYKKAAKQGHSDAIRHLKFLGITTYN